jgi:hypothetical protein
MDSYGLNSHIMAHCTLLACISGVSQTLARLWYITGARASVRTLVAHRLLLVHVSISRCV